MKKIAILPDMKRKKAKADASQRPEHPSIARARKVARLLDSAFTIPVIRKKIGIDPLLSAVPIAGDLISGGMAAYLLYIAHVELRLPRHVIVRMGVNTIADLLLGMLPVVGDVADIFWKSNEMNFKLMEEAYLQHGIGPRTELGGLTVIDTIAEPV